MKKSPGRKYSDEWITHFERSGFNETPGYDETVNYFKKFAEYSSYVKIMTFGLTPQSRELKLVIVSKEGFANAEDAKKSGKVIVLIQNCIHAGEPEGKDASMILLREILITKERESLLDNLILLIIPVFNIDGHERMSPFNRPNQIGPKQMGWRTNALNLNLNRDYAKADSPEMKAWLKIYNEWLPDFMIDNHTTNGADYQYHITYGIEHHRNISLCLSNWVKKKFLPYMINKVESDGYIVGPYVELRGPSLYDGIIDQPAPLMISNGYCAAQNRVCLLVESHSLKPFKERVFATLSMNNAALSYLNQNHKEIKVLNKKAERDTIRKYIEKKDMYPVKYEIADKHDVIKFKGYESVEEYSEVSGSNILKFTDQKTVFELPLYNSARVINTVEAPYAYLIPKEFVHIADILRLHNVIITTSSSREKLIVEKYRFTDFNFLPRPYEGRQLVKAQVELFEAEEIIPAGTFIVPTKQRTIRLILNLLEPAASDSFVSWGFFNAFFERKEYAEPYIMEPYAKNMIRNDFKLREEFFTRLEQDENFRNNPSERLDFFYQRSEYFDKQEKIYPVFRLRNKS